jgi:uncharacterized membrane protein YgdD (TMEM256/DUF423 family)
MDVRRCIVVGAVLGALAVVLGAFGAHALKERLGPEELAWWQTAVQYHGAHALAIVLYGVFAERAGRKPWPAAPLFAAGIVLFSGSLYAMALGAPRWLGAVTPLGGLAFIAGWLGFAWSARRGPGV